MCPPKQPATQAPITLENANRAPPAVLPGMGTPRLTESAEIVAERYELSLKLKRLERRLADIDAVLKARTGERQVGAYLVKVSSFTVERLDGDAVRQILGDATPTMQTVSTRLTVVPA